MKKVFSTVAMAIVAFTAVVSMSSCQNDSPSSFNAAPQVPETTQTTTQSTTQAKPENNSYAYQATIPSEVLEYFDIEITRTAGTDSNTFYFTQDSQINGMACVMTDVDSFKSDASGVSFVAKVTPKANWKDLVAENGLEKLYVSVSLDYQYKCCPRNYSKDLSNFVVFTDKSMSEIAKCLSVMLTLKGIKYSGEVE